MNSSQVLVDAFSRVGGLVHNVVGDLSVEQLARRVGSDANSIGWLVWHLTRIQDDHIAAAAGSEQVWTTGGWKDRFGLPFDDEATGFGHSSDEVAQVRDVSASLLLEYYDAVQQQTAGFLQSLSDADLDRIVDRRWDPPVTLGARLVSVLSDNLQHAGQTAFVKGLLNSAG
jgi:hypothetical protein